MNKIRILQLGYGNWNRAYTLPEEAELEYAEVFSEAPETPYDMVFLDRRPMEKEIGPLYQAAKAYTLYVTSRVRIDGRLERLYQCKKGKKIDAGDIQDFLLHEVEHYYPVPYGEKYSHRNLSISRDFTGSVKWDGNYKAVLEGEFGEGFRQIAFWRNNIPLQRGQTLDFWLEYKKTPGVEISFVITQFQKGSIGDISDRWEFTEEQLAQIVRVKGKEDGYIFAAVHARGNGKLQIIALHDRHSRCGYGYFLPGGERYVTSEREEIFCYFDPGDRKPPLNVYFSGYKTREGFEGYHMMRRMGGPFLLIAESRLEGGCFYMGSEEYEQMLLHIIRRYMGELKFFAKEVIFAGLSMGTFGALYYGCDIRPYAMILGKPLASIGNVAANEKWLRAGEFPTSLDVLKYLCKDMGSKAIRKLNDRFWNKFDQTDWGSSKFIVAYMIEDDYDTDAYDTILSHLTSSGVQVYGKGIHGRHNDKTDAIVSWFVSQFEKVLREDFSRTI